ncbi:uncharacterized protein BHQ10_003306 [Talaromyces amestolkiae]|uniref:Something about silencing protein 4 domain-containing protein n=1 Tax=Talaromyces amestolkiae TaxID=1196081 RepID=A0A364KUS3_TALAM|nr:uncharacterized protein BHQ10_003306 [Talaromyces amestolkiae]RAO67294.1 hypothetical protein BHQ10_003306 [Talaromyces amestolkiae]
MVGTSRSSIKDSVQPHQAHAKTPVHPDFQQLRDEGNLDNGINPDDRDQDEDEDELQVTQNPTNARPDNTKNSRKMLATSKSLPNLRAHTINSTTSTIKRPRLSSSTSPSPPPPSRTPLSHAPRSTPRRPPKRAPLTNRHPSGSQQTTLDKFFGGNSIKDKNTRAETETQRPTKKARFERDGDAAIGAQFTTSSSTAATTNQQFLDNRESPDPLNVISSPPNGDRVRTRQRSNTLTTSTTTGTTTIPTETTTSRSSRNKAHPVIIADDATTTKPENEVGVNAQSKPTNNTAQAQEKRSLRSHDGGSRSRSELALYFPNYEQIISLEPVKTEFLAPETNVTILDDLTEPPLPLPTLQSGSPSRTRKQRNSIEQFSPFGNPLNNLHGVEKIELPKVEDSELGVTDPLNENVYFKAHRRHERQEKQLRNIEKERAQHEKIQLDRLLDELQGHDWLRVMGISGITDTEKKLYEPKRDYFVKEVSALIGKFHLWKEEEKRRKHEREQMLLEAANAAAEKEEHAVDEEMSESEKPSSDIDSSELDAAAAQQLLQEARSATATGATTSSPPTPAHPQPRRRLVDELTSTPPKSRSTHHRTNSKHAIHTTTNQDSPSNSQVHHPEIQEYDENKPFTSFYRKRHLRDAAFSSSRRGGRNRSAFGQPLPELIEEREFELPSEILTSNIVLSLERKRRRLKRESRGG